MSCTAGMEINATTKSAMPIKAAMLNNRMRVRMRGSGAAASKSAIVTAAEIAKCAQAPREKLSNKPPIRKTMIASPVEPQPAGHEIDQTEAAAERSEMARTRSGL